MGRAEAFAPGVYAGALTQLPGIGAAAIHRAVERLGGLRQAWEAPAEAWQEASDRALSRVALSSLRLRRRPGMLRELHRALQALPASAVTPWDGEEACYPLNLLHVPDPPPVLYVRGSLAPEDRLAVAIVGSRQADVNGLLVAETLAAELAGRGFTIVSGLAAGIDGAAHRGAIRAGGRTIGVLGCGIDRVYPPQHRQLFEQVARCGALISEYPPGVEPDRWRFAARNRVIAALSLAVVVVEARSTSGALSTAGLADSFSRNVLAVPGDVTRSTCRGSNQLIADGCPPCLSPEDAADSALEVLRRLEAAEQQRPSASGGRPGRLRPRPVSRSTPAPPGPPPLDGGLPAAVASLYQALVRRPAEVEELSARTGLPVNRLVAYMTELEAAGRVRRLADGRWAARRLS